MYDRAVTYRGRSGRSLCALALALVVAAGPALPRPALAQPALAQPTPPPGPAPSDEVLPEEALTQRLALWRIDALGIDAELVGRLEALFRMELDRLATGALPSRRDIDKAIAGDAELGKCGGEDRCVAAIGKKLGVDVMITGSVAAMGDNYILNIKAVDVARGAQIRRIATDPLRGSPDELIDAIRVAAYRLLAPDQLYGSVMVLTDLIGATVTIDGKKVGATPLPGPVAKLPLGEHTLTVSAKGYSPFEETITVRFQKATRVVVRLVVAPGDPDGVAVPVVVERRRAPWYSSTWAYVGVGVVAVLAGVAIGYAASRPTEVDCAVVACR